jgi:uncharacterized damage-inducible protein DinB
MKPLIIMALAILFVTCSKKQDDGSLKTVLLQQLKNSHSKEEWFAPINVAVNGITAEQSNWKDSSDNHSIGQLVSHLVFWNERVLKSFQGNTPPDFKGDNATTFTQLNENEWNAATRKLDSIQTLFEQLVETGSHDQLKEWSSTIGNLGMHNAYHTGQIIYIRKRNGWWKPAR